MKTSEEKMSTYLELFLNPVGLISLPLLLLLRCELLLG